MSQRTSFHSICRWTFNAGKGGFVPEDIRPGWTNLTTQGTIGLIAEKILPRLPKNVVAGFEMHYNNEVNEDNAEEVAMALQARGIHLAMITPGAHIHFAYGGPASPDENEREAANLLARNTVDIVYGQLRKTWHPDPALSPTLVLWNGSWGYDLATPLIADMYANLKKSIADLCRYEKQKGGEIRFGLEPKPNEGHPAMLIPTVASAVLFWKRLAEEYKIDISKKGVNKEFGHSEMTGLDFVYDTVEELDNNMMTHVHINSQGYNDGLIYGGPGKFDIDHGARINGMNIVAAALMQKHGYRRWKGHDMQPRPYDNEEQAIERVIRSIISWEACEEAAEDLDTDELAECISNRDTAGAEDIMRRAVMNAYYYFDEMYKR